MRGTVDGKRVYLSPVSEMQKQLDAGEKRYEEILKACRKDPDRWYWYTDWTVHSKLIGCPVGTIRFGGPPQGGVLSLTCEIKEQYRRQGYGAEAVQAALQWANRRGDMYFTRVQVEDAAGEALARKLQFKSLPGKAGVWITERPRAKWLAGYLLVGLMIGLMMPCFLFAMFEKDGLPFEKVLRNIIRTRFLLPKVRPYKTDNFYAFLSRKEEHPIADQRKDSRTGRRKKAS